MRERSWVSQRAARAFVKWAGGTALAVAFYTGLSMVLHPKPWWPMGVIAIALICVLASRVVDGDLTSATALFVLYTGGKVFVYQRTGLIPGILSWFAAAMFLLGVLGAASLPRPDKAVTHSLEHNK